MKVSKHFLHIPFIFLTILYIKGSSTIRQSNCLHNIFQTLETSMNPTVNVEPSRPASSCTSESGSVYGFNISSVKSRYLPNPGSPDG